MGLVLRITFGLAFLVVFVAVAWPSEPIQILVSVGRAEGIGWLLAFMLICGIGGLVLGTQWLLAHAFNLVTIFVFAVVALGFLVDRGIKLYRGRVSERGNASGIFGQHERDL